MIKLGGVYLGKVEAVVSRRVMARKVGTHKSKLKPSRSSGLSAARRTASMAGSMSSLPIVHSENLLIIMMTRVRVCEIAPAK